MKSEDEIRRGNEASQIIGNPVYQEIVTVMRAQMFEAFERTTFDQVEEREEIYRMMKLMTKFEANIKSVADTGKMASVMQDAQTH